MVLYVTNLLLQIYASLCNVSHTLDSKKQVDVVYTDLTKAFDVVNHKILLYKLRLAGLCDNLVNLFESYFTDRSKYVEFNGYHSDSYIVCSGVGQGSNLGPILFGLYLNDALSLFNCSIFVYADDIKIAKCISSDNDCQLLQNDLNNFST